MNVTPEPGERLAPSPTVAHGLQISVLAVNVITLIPAIVMWAGGSGESWFP